MGKVIVMGGGAAGLMAAGVSASMGAEVLVIEKNKRPGRKICITGKGRCNVTNKCSNNDFIENVIRNPRFLYSAINAFSAEDTIGFFEDMGVPLKVERGNRVFPVSDKALDIANALERYCKNQGVKFLFETEVKDITSEGGAVKAVVDSKGKTHPCDAVIIASGGKSYHLTGSTGDGYPIAERLGHKVIKPTASLIPLECRGSDLNDCIEMQGLSLRNVGVKLYCGEKQVYEDFGELLFTHFGISGPTVLSMSTRLSDGEKYRVSIDLKPALDFEKLDARILRDFEKYKNRELSNALTQLLPSSMIPVVIRRLGEDDTLRVNSITKEQRHRLLSIIKNLDFEISGTRPLDEAIITRGGVDVSEVNPKTMESKLINGLFFCGEVLDVDAYTGGFNLQIAFSTGFLAGENSAWI
ncbi:MAG: NAD(P)/FAD-dependent oxidoreductase [Oscillospiraceae bacterium]|nr:NAD(P)/FAD-dependent oxidoreductase [Oscillospiraceae bacterium]